MSTQSNTDVIADAKTELSKWFQFTDSGLIVTGYPPKEAFDLLLFYLATRQDILALQTGDCVAGYHQRFTHEDYEKVAATLPWHYSPTTVETWATTCREVPRNVRVPGLSIYFYQVVAPLWKLPQIQKQLLEDCKAQEMSHAAFMQYVYKFRIDNYPLTKPPRNEPPRVPTYTSDVKQELTEELYNLEVAYQATEHAAAVAATEAERYRAALVQVRVMLAG
jgi:hypothetical protein